MGTLKISVLADDLQLPARDALRTVAQLGARGVQTYATRGELTPEKLSRSGRRDLARFVRKLGLDFTALCGDLGGGRFADAGNVEQFVEQTRRVLEMAREVGVPVVTAHAGPIPADAEDAVARRIAEAVREVGDFAERVGVLYALETGQESAATLAGLVERLGNPALGVAFDPADLILRGDDPIEAVEPVAGRIVYLHAKDAIQTGEGRGRIVPLGEGQLDYPALLAALEEFGYGGTHCIETRAADRVADARHAVEFLRRF